MHEGGLAALLNYPRPFLDNSPKNSTPSSLKLLPQCFRAQLHKVSRRISYRSQRPRLFGPTPGGIRVSLHHTYETRVVTCLRPSRRVSHTSDSHPPFSDVDAVIRGVQTNAVNADLVTRDTPTLTIPTAPVETPNPFDNYLNDNPLPGAIPPSPDRDINSSQESIVPTAEKSLMSRLATSIHDPFDLSVHTTCIFFNPDDPTSAMASTINVLTINFDENKLFSEDPTPSSITFRIEGSTG